MKHFLLFMAPLYIALLVIDPLAALIVAGFMVALIGWGFIVSKVGDYFNWDL